MPDELWTPKPKPASKKVTQEELWRPPFVCEYGCEGVWIGAQKFHSWDCLYWQKEGKRETPF